MSIQTVGLIRGKDIRVYPKGNRELLVSKYHKFQGKISGTRCVFSDDRTNWHFMIKDDKYYIIETTRDYMNRDVDRIFVTYDFSDLRKIYESKNAVAEVQNKIDKVKDVMSENIHLALENTAKLEDIEEASEELNRSAGAFRDNATKLRRKMCFKEWKMKIIFGLIALAVLGIIIGVIVGLSKQK